MCLAVPGKVLEIDGPRAMCDFNGIQRKATIALLPDVKVGDYVIVHAGCAISKMNEAEALASLKAFMELSEIDEFDPAVL